MTLAFLYMQLAASIEQNRYSAKRLTRLVGHTILFKELHRFGYIYE
jgi:hypothetical protein